MDSKNVVKCALMTLITLLLYSYICSAGIHRLHGVFATNPNGVQKDQHEEKQKTVTVDGVDIVMVYIPEGEYLMGSPETEAMRKNDEGAQHRVVINKEFWMGKYEVTQGQWVAVMGRNEAWFEEGDDYPIEWIAWGLAQDFIKKLNEKTGLKFRLPSEAEWEYACRAGTTTPFHFGESISSDQANFNGNFPYGEEKKGVYREGTCPVGSFQPNAWGLYDMHGNVWEWCEDVYRSDIYNHTELYIKNEIGNLLYSGEGSHRVFRGGGWLGNGAALRSASRSHELAHYSFPFIGFRLVLDD
jgi:formylglycine-generating enzyme required for sulfatase activity